MMAVKKKVSIPSLLPSTGSASGKWAGENKWATVGWGLLLVGGLAHMLPAQMAPLLKWSAYGVSLQMAVGVVSVVIALYFLLGNEE